MHLMCGQMSQRHQDIYIPATRKEPTFFLEKQTSHPHTLLVETDKLNVVYTYAAIKIIKY